MKRCCSLFVVYSVIFISLLPIQGCGKKAKKSVDVSFKLYKDEANSFKIGYPENWSIKKGNNTTAVSFLSPVEGSDDKFRENVNIIVSKMPPNFTFTDSNINYITRGLRRFIKNMKIIKKEKFSVNKMDAYRIIYTGNVGKYNVKYQQVIISSSGDKAYIITYTAFTNTFDKYINIVNKMIQTMDSL